MFFLYSFCYNLTRFIVFSLSLLRIRTEYDSLRHTPNRVIPTVNSSHTGRCKSIIRPEKSAAKFGDGPRTPHCYALPAKRGRLF